MIYAVSSVSGQKDHRALKPPELLYSDIEFHHVSRHYGTVKTLAYGRSSCSSPQTLPRRHRNTKMGRKSIMMIPMWMEMEVESGKEHPSQF